MRLTGKLVAVAVVGLTLAGSARAENYAFLVAVQDYNVKSLKPLKFTRNDIQAFSKVLQASGFKPENIVVMSDKPDELRFAADAERIRKQLDTLLAGLEEKDTLVVAFAGHGVQYEGDPKNYFCPVDADLEDSKRAKLIAISEIYDKLKQCPASRKLLVVDACRKEPQTDIARSRDTVKLNSVTRPQGEPVPKGVVALFSCSAGQEAFEWPDLKHGIFFHHFIEGWEGAAAQGEQQVTLDQVVAYAKLKTQTFARLKIDSPQTPQVRNEFEGTWVLRRLASEIEKEFTNGIGMKLRLIPNGTFQMGEPFADLGSPDELPPHVVTIKNAFYLGKYEVTRGEFKKFVEDRNYKTEAEKNAKGGWGYLGNGKWMIDQDPKFTWRNAGYAQTDEHPVVNVSWNDAVEFCRWLSHKEGKAYRLPTEAEWEYACRATTVARWHDPDLELQRSGNIADISLRSIISSVTWSAHWNDGYAFTSPVGKFDANKFGVHDMHGNVREWCSDWYDKNYYKVSPVEDPQGPSAKQEHRSVRGTEWGDNKFKRAAFRDSRSPEYCNHDIGFRVVGVVPVRTH